MHGARSLNKANFELSCARYFETLGKLCTYDMIKRNPRTASLSIHRLVQQAILRRMTKEKYVLILEAVIMLLSQLYPRQSLGMAVDNFWKDCALDLPQVLKIASHYKYGDEVRHFARVLMELLHNATWSLSTDRSQHPF